MAIHMREARALANAMKISSRLAWLFLVKRVLRQQFE
jgi:hypothetical protein